MMTAGAGMISYDLSNYFYTLTLSLIVAFLTRMGDARALLIRQAGTFSTEAAVSDLLHRSSTSGHRLISAVWI